MENVHWFNHFLFIVEGKTFDFLRMIEKQHKSSFSSKVREICDASGMHAWLILKMPTGAVLHDGLPTERKKATFQQIPHTASWHLYSHHNRLLKTVCGDRSNGQTRNSAADLHVVCTAMYGMQWNRKEEIWTQRDQVKNTVWCLHVVRTFYNTMPCKRSHVWQYNQEQPDEMQELVWSHAFNESPARYPARSISHNGERIQLSRELRALSIRNACLREARSRNDARTSRLTAGTLRRSHYYP